MSDPHEERWILTERGMRFLAERAGVPPASFARHGGITYFDAAQGEAPDDAVRFVEHTIGVNRFIVRVALDTRAHGWRLIEARNEAESTRRFTPADAQTSWIRPDASGVIDAGGERLAFIVEYDRGTLSRGDYRAKFSGYRRYYGTGAWSADFPCEPVLLFVCVDDRAERRVLRAMTRTGTGGPAFVTSEWRYETKGTLSKIWMGQASVRQTFVPGPVPEERCAD